MTISPNSLGVVVMGSDFEGDNASMTFSYSVGVSTDVGTIVTHQLGAEGAWVVCWPTLFTDHRGMLDFAELIERKHRVLIIDPPGYFASNAIARFPEFGPLLNATVQVLDHLEIDRFHWVGCGFGGHMGCAVAKRLPKRMISLTLSSTPLLKPAALKMLAVRFSNMLYFTSWGRTRMVRYLAEQMLNATNDERRLTELHMARTFKDANVGVTSRIRPTKSGQLKQLREWLLASTQPTLFIAGERDLICKARDQKTASELMPHSRYVAIDSGFLTFATQPEACASAWLEFVQQLRS
jgi:pimeloyl-ACP methyl ester carboxylesterase